MGIIQLSKFMGRWGNCIGQYAVARAAAANLSCHLETPDWIGRQIFVGVDNPLLNPSRRLPALPQDQLPDRPNTAIHGYYQNQQAFDLLRRRQLKHWLTIKPDLLAMCPPPRPFYVVCHVRRGDYMENANLFAVVERICFERALAQYNYDLRDVVWLTEEAPQPGTANMPPGMEFLYDFMVLLQADIVFRANSTFSYWGAALGRDKKIYSPVIGNRAGICEDIQFVEGNHSATIDPQRFPRLRHTDMVLRD